MKLLSYEQTGVLYEMGPHKKWGHSEGTQDKAGNGLY